MKTHVGDLPPETNVFLFAKTLTSEMNAPRKIRENIANILTILYQTANYFHIDYEKEGMGDYDIY